MASDYMPGKGPRREAIDPAFFRPMPPVLAASSPYRMPRAEWVDTPQVPPPVVVATAAPTLGGRGPLREPIDPAFFGAAPPLLTIPRASSAYVAPRAAVDPRVFAAPAPVRAAPTLGGRGPLRTPIDPAFFGPQPPTMVNPGSAYSMPRAAWVDTPAKAPSAKAAKKAAESTLGKDLVRVLGSAAVPVASMVAGGVPAAIYGAMRGSGGELPGAAAGPPLSAADIAVVQAEGDRRRAAKATTASTPKTLQEAREAALMTVLGDPEGVSLNDLMAVGQAAPGPAQRVPFKDVLGTQASEFAQAIFAKEMQQVSQIEDPDERDAEGAAASERLMQRITALLGGAQGSSLAADIAALQAAKDAQQ